MADEAPQLVHAQEPPEGERRAMKLEEKQMLHELATVAQQTFAPWRAHMMQAGASPNSDMMLASAMATFAGAIVGELVGMGLCPETTVDKALDTFRVNMEAGVEIGKKHVARVADKVLQEEARQQGTERKQ